MVISVGGSLIVPDQIDTAFLAAFKALILKEIKPPSNRRFVVICGGGKVCRRYQEALRQVSPTTREDIDWMGIHATRLNAELMRLVCKDVAYESVIENPTVPITTDKAVMVACGWKPGCSTDYDAILVAENLGVQKLVNLSNIDYAYTADPRIDPAATPIRETTWTQFQKLLPEEWSPGLSAPFDPVAAKKARALGIEVAIINGAKLDELQKYLSGIAFTGTIIRPD